MNNNVKSNFSLRKLLLTALVAGPVGILPAPLWALPSTASSNLTTSAGVVVASGGATSLNITSPDKGVLTWGEFGANTNTVAVGDTINYILPSATSSVLNMVSGASASTINGNLVSNGKLFVLNPNGIVIGSGATVNAAGFYASAINEPLAAAAFAVNGDLTYNGTGTGTVTVSHTNAAASAPAIQAVGTGNNIVLAGAQVAVNAGAFYGNVTARTLAPAAAGNTVTLGNGYAVSVSGDLTINSNGGNVALTSASTAATATANIVGGAITSLTLGTAGAGYAPSSTVAVTMAAPTLALTGGTNTVTSGTAASYIATTDALGRIASFTVVNAGSGYTAAPAVTFGSAASQTVNVGGKLTLNTTSSTLNGTVTNDSGNRLTVTGATAINSYTSGATGTGDVTLSSVDLGTVALTSVGKTNISDSLGGITLDGGTVNSTGGTSTDTSLTISASGSSIASTTKKITIVPSATVTDPRISLTASSGAITYNGTGALNIGTLSSSTTGTGVATVTSDGNITLVNSFGGRNLSITSSAGTVTTANLTNTSGTFTISAASDILVGATSGTTVPVNTTGVANFTSTAGKVTVGQSSGTLDRAIAVGSGSKFVGASDVAIAGAGLSAPSVTITSSGGSVTLGGAFSGSGTITAATNVVLGAAGATSAGIGGTVTTNVVTVGGNTISGGVVSVTLPSSNSLGAGYAPNSSVALTITGGGGAGAAGYATTGSDGRISGYVITAPGSGYTTSPTIGIASAPTNSVVANGALAITANNGSITFGGPIVSTSSSSLDLKSSQNLVTPSITAPTLSLTTTVGNISQAAATSIVSTSKTTVSAATDATLSQTSNDFANVVVLASPNGATIADTNDIVLGGGTDAKGNLTISSGNGVTSLGANLANVAVTIASPSTTALAAVTTNANSGTVASAATSIAGSGYAPSTTVAVTFSAPPTSVQAAPINVSAASITSTFNSGTNGYVLNATNGVAAVYLPKPIGRGYLPNSILAVQIDEVGGGGVGSGAAGYATVNGNGMISAVVITSTGTNYTRPQISFPAPVAQVTATGYATTSSSGAISGIVITEPGAGYYGSIVPTITIAAPTGGTAGVALGSTNAAGALTSVAVNTAGDRYFSAPAITLSNGAKATATVASGAITAITPSAISGITLGSTAADSIKVAGNLALTSTAPAGTVTASGLNYSEINTVSRNVTVAGSVTATTANANATLGVAPGIGQTATYAFGQQNASVGTGTLNLVENGNVDLGTITAGTLNVQSLGDAITNSGAVTVAGVTTLTANTIFSPSDITLSNALNALSGTIIVNNANNVTVSNTVNTTLQNGNAAVSGKGIAGSANVTASAGRNITFTAAGPGDYTVVGFNASGAGNVTIAGEPNGLTLQNAVNSGSGTVTVSSSGPVVLGSGITLGSTGLTSIASTGASANITDGAAGIVVFGPIALTSANGISVTRAGHNFGPVTLTTTGANGATSTSTSITFTESGTLNLDGVTVNQAGAAVAGNLALTSTTGSIIQKSTAGVFTANVVTQGATALATQTATFTAAGGVTLNNTNGNAINTAIPVTITAGGDSGYVAAAGTLVTLGNVRVSNGAFTSSVGGAGTISQATGTTLSIFGNSSFTTANGKITLTNSGNNFGALTLVSAGADVALTEANTVNLSTVNTGAGKLTVTSENAGIISTTPAINVGGSATLSAKAAGITLNTGNTFGGANGIVLITPGSVTLQDGAATTTLLPTTQIGGSLTLRNTANGNVNDAGGNVSVTGSVLFDVGTGNVNIIGSGNSFGPIQFRAGNVSIAQNTTLSLNAGSVATGLVNLSSLADIVTVGAGTSIFTGGNATTNGLTLSAGGAITISNPIYVANGLTFRALGAVDLSSLSLLGNLNSRTPTNLGAASYKAPQP